MTIEELNIVLGADDSSLGHGLSAAITKLQNFGTTANAIAKQATAGFSQFADQAKANGTRAADEFAAGFNSLNAKLAKTFADIDKRKDELEKGFGRLGESFTSVGKGLTAGVTAPLLLLGSAAIKTFGDIEALEKGFKAVYKGSGDVEQELQKVIAVAKLPGLGLAEAIQGSVRLQAVGISAEQARKSLLAFGNAIATTGGGKSELGSVTTQLAQLSAKGKVLAQDLRPIIEAAPAVAQALQKLYGTVDSQDISAALAKQGKSSKDFIAALTDELAKLPSVAGGVKNALENVADSTTLALSKIGESISKNIGFEGIAERVGSFVTKLADSFSNLPTGTQKAILGVAGVAAAIGPLSLAIGGLLTILPTLAAGFAVLTGPVGLTIAAIAAGAALIISNWESVSAYFNSDAGKPFRELASTVGDTLKTILSLVGDFGNSFGGLFSSAFKEALKLILPVLQEIVSELNNSLKAINALVKLATADNSREWSAGYSELEEVTKRRTGNLLGLVAAFTKDAIDLYTKAENAIGNISLVPKQKGVSISEFFANDFANAAANQWEALADASLKAAAADEAARVAAEKHAKTLGGLKEALQAAKDKLDTLIGGTAEFDSTKAEIVRLTELIKKLEDTGKAAKKAADDIAKAFAEIKTKLSGVDTRVQLHVESNFDAVIEKIKIVEDGIKLVTDKGVKANNPALIALSNQLIGLQAQLKTIKESFATFVKPSNDDGSDIYDADIKKIQKALDDANLTAKIQFELDGDKAKLANALADAQKTATAALSAAQVPSSNPQAQSIALGVKPLADSAFNADSLKEYLQAMKAVSAEQQIFGSRFNESAAAMNATAQRLRDLISLGQTGTVEFATLTARMKELKQAADWSDLQQNIGSALSDALTELGTVVGEQLGNVLAGVSSGQDALAAVFNGVLVIFGGFLIDLGKMLIQYALLQLLATELASNPYTAVAAIAVGVAAIAVGAAFKAAASKGPSGGGASSASSYRPSTSSGSTPSSSSATKNGTLTLNVTFAPIVMTADGPTLRSVAQADSYRLALRQ